MRNRSALRRVLRRSTLLLLWALGLAMLVSVPAAAREPFSHGLLWRIDKPDERLGDPAPTLDQRLYARTRARRMEIVGLELVDEQVAVFESLSLATQIALLEHALVHREDYRSLQAVAIDARLAGDLARLVQINAAMGERFPTCASTSPRSPAS